MQFDAKCPKRTAKPLFIGSIPIAASNKINSLEPSLRMAFSFCVRNVCEILLSFFIYQEIHLRLMEDSLFVFFSHTFPHN